MLGQLSIIVPTDICYSWTNKEMRKIFKTSKHLKLFLLTFKTVPTVVVFATGPGETDIYTLDD